MLDKIITSKTRRKLLALFLTNPDSEFYLRELSRKTGEQLNSVRIELKNLEEAGLLNTKKVANLCYYRVNKNFAIFNELKGVILKTDATIILISEVIKRAKEKFGKNLTSVALFGSAARNEIKENSDIDFLIICKSLPESWRDRDNETLEIEKVGFNFGRAVHIEMLNEKELSFSVEKGAPLLFEISKDNKILFDNGFFKKQIVIFNENIKKWNARKTDKFTWEVPLLGVKV